MSITDQIKSVRQTVGREYIKPDPLRVEKFIEELWCNETALDYLRKERALSDDTIRYFKLGYDSEKNAVAIPIYKKDELVNIKYRFLSPDKIKYTSERGAETWLYHEKGIQYALQKGGVLIVEGEFDLMSCYQAGIKNVVSPASGKDSYGVWVELLDPIARVYLSYDNDEAGRGASKKFAERVGSDKCFEVKYPEFLSGVPIKDANDFFKVGTVEQYKELIKSAQPYYSYQFKNLGDIITYLRKSDTEELELVVIPKVKMEKDWLVVVSGKSNIGKTSYCMNIADELAGRGIPCLVMPFERGIASVGKRYLQVHFDKSSDDFKFTSSEAWEEMIGQVVELPVYFSTPRKEDIREIVIKAKRLFDTRVVIIDHLDYIVRHVNGNREAEIANTLQSLKSLGSEHGIIFIIVTHIRKIEQAGSQVARDPNIEDLKGSSSLYQDPECVVLLSSDCAGTLKVKIAKNKGEMRSQSYLMREETGKMVINPLDTGEF